MFRVILAVILVGFVAHRAYYTALLLILGSPLLIAANWFVGGLWLGMTCLDIASRIRTEEAMMLDRFGERYRAYMHRTGRLVPRLAKRRLT